MEKEYSDDFIKKLTDSLLKWAKRKTSYIFTGFFAEQDLDYETFMELVETRVEVKKAFSRACNHLNNHWFEKINKDDASRGILRLCAKYMSFLDKMLYHHEKERQKELAYSNPNINFYNYSDSKLEPPFDRLYNANEDKRRKDKGIQT